MKKINILLCFLLLPLFSPNVFGSELGGTGWFAKDVNGDKRIILLEKDGTFTYLNVTSISGNEGEVWGDDKDTWEINNDLLILSYTNGYRICSFKKTHFNSMSGNCINKRGNVDKVQLSLINER